ncbi:MAG: 8-oxo-dGTP diphosphatase [Verrucomicrobiales bacterium]|nr:8-oxo-dGTP diphosphatase [Verrucomicrobiales bacterium]MED5585118.1 8-oxo-dGTP diphosphatase [Verrucomicrobiota bacterium]
MNEDQYPLDPASIDWTSWRPSMRATLLFLHRGSEILLIHKKSGLGRGKVNAPGGKIEQGESASQAAVREVSEEVGIDVRNPEEMGILRFQFIHGERLALHCVVFRSFEFSGEAHETPEADPFWCPVDRVPYEKMWSDDQYWLPGLLQGGKFDADFVFDDEELLWRNVRWR